MNSFFIYSQQTLSLHSFLYSSVLICVNLCPSVAKPVFVINKIAEFIFLQTP